MNGQDIELYFFNNPPFEITDKAKYLEFLQFQSKMTMMELSENNPVLSESEVAPISGIEGQEMVLFDLKSLNENFMDLILFQEKEQIAEIFSNNSFINVAGGVRFGEISSAAMTSAMRSNSVLNLLALNDYVPIIEEWFLPKKQFMIFDNSFIKILPDTAYYALYKRYKTINELNMSEMRIFKNLFGINIMLDIYQSDIFASEGGIRSVSLSGLSVSFNVPEASSKVEKLQAQKSKILDSIALDYSDGCVGLIYMYENF